MKNQISNIDREITQLRIRYFLYVFIMLGLIYAIVVQVRREVTDVSFVVLLSIGVLVLIAFNYVVRKTIRDLKLSRGDFNK